jgi:hypothetical protein
MTNLPDGFNVIRYDANVPRWRVIELVSADFFQVGSFWIAYAEGKYFALRDGELVLATLIVPVQQFSGPGITDYKISVGSLDLSYPELYATATDVDVAPGDGVFRLEDRRVLPSLSTSVTPAYIFASSTGALPNTATSGKVRVHMLSVRPWPYTRDIFNPVP